MRPVNFFRVSRISDEDLFNIAEKHEACDHDDHSTPVHEIESLRLFADSLKKEGVGIRDADGFYFGYIIPLIGKEFDLLKVTGGFCLNIELKSQDVGTEQMAAQLLKNRHYLTLLDRELMLFTVVTDSMTCYRLNEEGRLERTELREVAKAVRKCSAAFEGRIDKLFNASEYLISPEREPEKFLNRQYFLTPAQEQVKKDLIKALEGSGGCRFYHIAGKPCSGKTLLVFDIARDLSEKGLTLVVSGREVTDGLVTISESIESLDFIGAGSIRSEKQLKKYEYILVDETLHLRAAVFDIICSSARKREQVCVFSTDPASLLTSTQEQENITDRVHDLHLAGEFELSEKIRMNKEIYSFIMKLKHLSAREDKTYEYDNVSVSYANDIEEAREIIQYYRGKDYKFINAHITADDPFADLAEDYSSHHVAGREYGRVVMLMDSSFSYDDEGYLQGIPKPDPENLYPNLFYQGITRVRERLAIVVLAAPELLRCILSIVN